MKEMKIHKQKKLWSPGAAPSLQWFLISTMVNGIAVGLGVTLGSILIKRLLKTSDQATGWKLPEEVKKEYNK